MVTQNSLTQTRKLKLRWFVTISTLPFLAVLSAFGVIPQSEISFAFNQSVTEEVTLSTTNPHTDKNFMLWRIDRMQLGDTVSELLRRLGVDDIAADNYLRENKSAASLLRLSTGKNIQAETLADGKLASLRFLDNANNQVVIKKENDHFTTQISSAQIEKRILIRSGEINSSLFAATDAADIPDAIAAQLADIFSGEIDFQRDLRKNDTFSVIYEMNFNNGEPVSTGNVLAAEFSNQDHIYKAIYYEITPGIGNYYSPDGKSMRKAFLRSPLEYSRISSGFKRTRFHPILNKWRAHKGVDYAAAIGTKVKATADGIITFVGKQGDYGDVVTIRHQGNYSTVYGHLSRFSNGLHRGQHVSQGELIAYVGKTGMATGPHLHYEFKINGKHHDPLRVALPDAKPISEKQKSQFISYTYDINERLNMISNYRLSMTQ